MDHVKADELSLLATHQIELAKKYAIERMNAGTAKTQLELLLTSEMREILRVKKNAGYDVAMLLLLELKPEMRPVYENFRRAEANYKGLEKLIEAHQSKISVEQSIMKYIGQGEKYGG
jgi:hypothetical protein